MPEQIRRRNPVARSPLLRKGAIHEKSKAAVRRNNKLALTQFLDDWEEELVFERDVLEKTAARELTDVVMKNGTE